MTPIKGPRYVIRLSRDPAIPTFLARDGRFGDYATSFESRALHYTKRQAEHANQAKQLGGTIRPCACERPQP